MKGKISLRQFLKKRKLIVLLVSIMTSLSLIFFSVFGSHETPKPISWMNDLTAVVGRAVSSPGNFVMNFGDSISSLKNTYEENQSLKKQIGVLQDLKVQNESLKAENKELNDLLEIKPTLVDKKVIGGNVIARSPDFWVDYITIDLGSNNGLTTDMSVMSASGLIGRIVEVNPTSSKVQLLTSTANKSMEVAASIQIKDQIVHGVIKEFDRKEQELILSQVAQDAKINKGDMVTTSGLGGVSPEGIIIGEVVDAKMDEFGLSQKVRVKPAADFDDIRKVFVVVQDEEAKQAREAAEEEEGEASDEDSSND
ncbi:rod shape-determining protein MreC [Aerococcus sp. UMB8608]|uniref:Cell shape-determining protein MreC n=1 Tax=Aerococcus sanguinicola TaxID=119206 RepID=A0A5N1GNU6_9LACT|nr:rod shape-determining protein MreC [Aerococcus sanguinicola]MDK6680276.1 rod shape-determining protein MreC [Aerococcus sp. UMB8608]OFK16297.1 rod shape-determining protein MreC [Aerococcus sp. HMSC072A12]OFR30814.1 rod shape-determining protein MreC [Aerococcus sp. HMSC061A03]OFT42419.1 rod shape-determining protein MreC [Aerococcus sp. HMSC06H08]